MRRILGRLFNIIFIILTIIFSFRVLFTSLTNPLPVSASINEQINFQGKVTNTDGTNVADGTYDFVIKAYDGASSIANNLYTESWTSSTLWSSTMTSAPSSGGESLVYSSNTNESSIKVGQILWNVTKKESVYVTSVDTSTNTLGISPTAQAWSNSDTVTNEIYVKDGIFRIAIGSLTPFGSSIDFNTSSLFVGVNFNGDGEMKPRAKMASTPYAFDAERVNGSYSGTTGDANSISLTGLSTTANALNVDQTVTYNGGTTITNSGSLISMNRGLTASGASTVLNDSGALLTLTGNCTATSGGSCNDTGNILSLTQSDSSATGAVITLANSGTGADISGTGGSWTISKTGAITSSATGNALTLSGISSNIAFTATSGTNEITTGSGVNLALRPGGNVGIGLTNPVNPFEVLSTTTTQVKIAYDATHFGTFGVNSSGQLAIASSPGGLTLDSASDRVTDFDGLQINSSFITFANSGGTTDQINTSNNNNLALMPNGSGNVGIGDTTPASLFTVGNGDLFQINSSGNIVEIGGAAHTIQNSSGVLAIDAASSGALNLNGIGTGDVNIAGGSAATGCTITNSNGNLACSGTITSTASSGALGWWTRTGTSLAPSNSGDAITTSGNISTTSSGAITSAGTLTASNGFTLTTGTLSLTTNAAATLALAANTASALNITNGSNSYFNIDTRTANNGSSAFTFTPGTAPSIASGASSNYILTTFTPGTYTFTGTTNTTSTGISAPLGALFNEPTIAGNGTRTISETSNLLVNGPSIATSSSGTETITNAYGLNILSGSALNGTNGVVTNGYGLSVNAPTGATNNYAAVFNGGSVGIGTSTPGSTLEVDDFGTSTSTNAIAYKPAVTAPTYSVLFSGGSSTYTSTSNMMAATNDFKYYGFTTSKFQALEFSFSTPGVGYDLSTPGVEYCSQITTGVCTTWTRFSPTNAAANSNMVKDNTNNLSSSGETIIWLVPSDWISGSVNGNTAYWIRLSTSSTPSTVAVTSSVNMVPISNSLALFNSPNASTPVWSINALGQLTIDASSYSSTNNSPIISITGAGTDTAIDAGGSTLTNVQISNATFPGGINMNNQNITNVNTIEGVNNQDLKLTSFGSGGIILDQSQGTGDFQWYGGATTNPLVTLQSSANGGNVGIGTTSSPSNKLQVGDTISMPAFPSPYDVTNSVFAINQTDTGTSNSQFAANFVQSVAPTSNQANTGGRVGNGTENTSFNAYDYIPSSNTFNIGQLTGMGGSAENYGTGSVDRLVGSDGWGYAKGNASISGYVAGGWFGAEVDAGTVANLYNVDTWSGVMGGTVTNDYGIYLQEDNSGGTVTNRYGLYLASSAGSATNDYGIYEAGTQQNYLAGNLMLGGTGWSTYPLNVFSNVAAQDTASIQNTNTSGYSDLDFFNSSSSLVMSIGYGNSGTPSPFTSKNWLQNQNTDFEIVGGASGTTPYYYLTNGGNTYINTTSNPTSNNAPTLGILQTGSEDGINMKSTAGSDNMINMWMSGGTGSMLTFKQGASETVVGSISINTTNTAFNTSSDQRLKENITPTTIGLDTLMKIPVRDFDYIRDPSNRTQGFIAQELYSVYPYAVTVGGTDPNTNPWTVDYGRLTPLIIESTQEIANKNTQQDQQITQLTTQLSDLQTKEASDSSTLVQVQQSLNDLISKESTESADSSDKLNLFSPDSMTASSSATLGNLNITNSFSSAKIDTLDLTVSNTFKSLGDTFLGKTTIAGDFTVDGTLSITGNSINSISPTSSSSDSTLDGVLYIQNSPFATLVDFFNGLVTIDKNGTIIAKEIQADTVTTNKLIIKNNSSQNTTSSPNNDTIGSGTIPAGQTEVPIFTGVVTNDSKIFLQPRSKTGGQTITITGTVEGAGFVASVDHSISSNINFDWWVVGTK